MINKKQVAEVQGVEGATKNFNPQRDEVISLHNNLKNKKMVKNKNQVAKAQSIEVAQYINSEGNNLFMTEVSGIPILYMATKLNFTDELQKYPDSLGGYERMYFIEEDKTLSKCMEDEIICTFTDVTYEETEFAAYLLQIVRRVCNAGGEQHFPTVREMYYEGRFN